MEHEYIRSSRFQCIRLRFFTARCNWSACVFVRHNDVGEEFDLFSFPSRLLLCVIFCLQQSFGFPDDPSDDGTIAVCAETVVEEKHGYPLLLSTAMVRSGLQLLDTLTTFLFLQFRRLLPEVTLCSFQCFIFIHTFQRNLAVPMTRKFHECIVLSATEPPT